MMKLYSRSGTGALLVWEIEIRDESFEHTHLSISWGQQNCVTQIKTVFVEENQSGRDLNEQCELEMSQRISRKKQQGYTEHIPVVGAKITNALGLPKPMLAQKYKGQTIDTGHDTMWTQPKLDGNRCLIKVEDGKVTAYTRNGKIINTIHHITDELSKCFFNSKFILDGELYCHGESLQTIVSWIKRKQENTKKIKFMCYDVVEAKQYHRRHCTLEMIFLKSNGFTNLELVETTEHNYIDKEVATDMMMEYREQGYEGAIIRHGDKGYEDGKRSKSLLKVKFWQDGEFKIIGIDMSKDGHGILVCQADNTKIFKCNPPGDFDFRFYVAENPDEFIGKFVTVEYANLTAKGIPFHPIAKCMVFDKEL